MKTVVIGSGMSGPTAATYLAPAGHHVEGVWFIGAQSRGGITGVMKGARHVARRILSGD